MQDRITWLEFQKCVELSRTRFLREAARDQPSPRGPLAKDFYVYLRSRVQLEDVVTKCVTGSRSRIAYLCTIHIPRLCEARIY